MKPSRVFHDPVKHYRTWPWDRIVRFLIAWIILVAVFSWIALCAYGTLLLFRWFSGL